VWVLHYLAQHQRHQRDLDAALALADRALALAPEVPELLVHRGKVLRRAGDAQGAAHCADEARKLDLADRCAALGPARPGQPGALLGQHSGTLPPAPAARTSLATAALRAAPAAGPPGPDRARAPPPPAPCRPLPRTRRYLNSMAFKALFQAGLTAQADRTAALFTRDGDQTNNLFDMQHMWYELAAGKAYLAAGRHGPALKKLTAVVRAPPCTPHAAGPGPAAAHSRRRRRCFCRQ
jgi:tetratricopeptide (TPR) repeat protein